MYQWHHMQVQFSQVIVIDMKYLKGTDLMFIKANAQAVT